MTSGEVQFAAFLSYSRKDVRLARWLVRSLEEFRLPRQTVEDLKARRAPFVAARPIFRDEHDMPVGGVISERLSEMLDASATMIVLCSGSSAKSDWVNKEIALFASRHPDRRIIPAVAEGEPDSDESYPPALLKLGKPLAADLRNPGERRQSVIKIAAAVLGLDVDHLVGRVRKHQTEQRRWLAVGVAAAAAVVIGLGATAGMMANNAKQADDRAYEQVEQLLTKTRADMDDLAAKKALHEAAKLYFDSKAGRRLSDRDLLLKAEWLRQEGVDAAKRKQSAEALSYRQSAYQTTSELLKRGPETPDFLFSHSQSAFWVGYYYFEHGPPDLARKYLEAYRNAAATLFAMAPDYANAQLQTDARSEVHYANVNLGMLALEEERNARAAATAFSEALKILQPNPKNLAANLNLSRSHLQYIDALAQFAPASDVIAAVQIWEPLLDELEAYRDKNDEVDFHLANSWGLISAFEQHLSSDWQTRTGATREAQNQKPKRDPDNVIALSLAAQIDLKDLKPNCGELPPADKINVGDKLELGQVRECIAVLSIKEQRVRCGEFANALTGRRASLDLEPNWASLLTACSNRTAIASDPSLSKRMEGVLTERFSVHQPEEMRLRTQLALASFQTAKPHAWIAELNSSLDSRGWATKGEN